MKTPKPYMPKPKAATSGGSKLFHPNAPMRAAEKSGMGHPGGNLGKYLHQTKKK